MDNNSVLNKSYFMNDNINDNNFKGERTSKERTSQSTAIGSMIAEGGENFFHYLNSLDLVKDPNLMVLSSSHHYYYDYDDLQSVRTLINLKKLNLIKHLDRFLHTLFRILPQNAHFIGYFSDSKTLYGTGFIFNQPSRLVNRFINFLDSRTDRDMDKNGVSKLFESHGFKVIDMTDINGQTYFSTRKN